jgi:hypothetical protein
MLVESTPRKQEEILYRGGRVPTTSGKKAEVRMANNIR